MTRNVQKKPPTISVVIPTYNSGPYLEEALSSIWKQTLLPNEIIVVDDNSTDGTPARVEALAKQSPVPLKLIRRETNSGFPGRPMNDGVAAASGELVAILDHDDVWLPTKLQLQSQALQSHPEAGFAFSLHLTMGSPKACQKRTAARSAWLKNAMSPAGEFYRAAGSVVFDLFMERENFVVGFPGFMFRRHLWQTKGGFDDSVKIATDYDFLCWLCGQGDALFVPEVHFFRREHDDNLTGRELLRVLDVVRVMLRYIPATEMAARSDYQRILARRICSLAMHFARAGRLRQGMQLLRVVAAMNFPNSVIAWKVRTLPTKLLRLRAWRVTGLGPAIRDVTATEADEAVATLSERLADYRQQTPAAVAERTIDA